MATDVNRGRMNELIKDCPPWYKVPSLIKLYFFLIAPIVTSTAWGFDNSLTNGLQSIDAFMNNFGNPTGSTLGFFGASMSVGGIVGCLVSGPLTDRFGRRIPTALGAMLIMGMAIMQTFSTNFHMFIGGKVLVRFGSFIQQVAAPVLVSELAHPKQRVAISSLYNTNIFIGMIIGAWVAFITHSMDSQWSWKLPCILQVAIPSYQAVMTWFCPESPRWLVSKGRIQEAREILIKYHGNGIEDEIVRLELQEIIAGIETDKTMMKLNWDGIKSTLKTKGNRHRLWLCIWTAVGSQTIGGGFTASYLPLILDQIGMRTQKQKTLVNALLNVWAWIVALTGAFIIPRVGRRTIFLASAIGVEVTFIIWTVLTALYHQEAHVGLGIGVLVMIAAGSFCVSLCWIPLVIAYPIECVTTRQRGVYFAITLFTVNVTAFINSYISPIGIQAIGWRYYIPTCVWNLVLILVVWFTFVETTGMTLEEIAGIFDKADDFDNAVVAVGDDLNRKEGLEVASHVESVKEKA